MTSDQDQSKHLVKLLTNGKSKVQPGQTDTQRQEIQSVEDILDLLDPVKEELTVFKTIIFDGNPDTVANFNETFRIPYEGVFSTYFLFGQYKTIKIDNGNSGESGDLNKPNRALMPTQAFDTSKPHLLVKGQISFVNSFGYLNAD